MKLRLHANTLTAVSKAILKPLVPVLLLAAYPTFCQNPTVAAFPPVPTTKVLAIGHLTPATSASNRQSVMLQEVQDTVRLYLAGKIDQWYLRKDQAGVVFVLNVESLAEAQGLLEKLPLAKKNLMQFDLIPLGPLNSLALLLK